MCGLVAVMGDDGPGLNDYSDAVAATIGSAHAAIDQPPLAIGIGINTGHVYFSVNTHTPSQSSGGGAAWNWRQRST